jgi:hypothetical protein
VVEACDCRDAVARADESGVVGTDAGADAGAEGVRSGFSLCALGRLSITLVPLDLLSSLVMVQ